MEDHYKICEKNGIVKDDDIIKCELTSTKIDSSRESLTVTESNETSSRESVTDSKDINNRDSFTTRDSLRESFTSRNPVLCPYCNAYEHQPSCKLYTEPCKDCGRPLFVNDPKKVERHIEICNFKED